MMNELRCVSLLAAVGGLALAQPAAAQFFLATPDIRGGVVRGDEPGIGEVMPGATDDEVRAELVWNMRSGLNVAALQCQFEPTLMSVQNYNTLLYNHRAELKKAFDTLTKYFTRINKAAKAGQTALDRFGTRTYTGFTAVASQYGFCQTAAAIAAEAAMAPRGGFYEIAAAHMRELRTSLIRQFSEQRFSRFRVTHFPPLPRLDDICWDKKGQWVDKKCGGFAMYETIIY
jgi:hypothetical protein